MIVQVMFLTQLREKNIQKKFGTTFEIQESVLVKFKDKIGKATLFKGGFFVYQITD